MAVESWALGPFCILELRVEGWSMSERTVVAEVQVVNPHGMHLRPADLFVRTAMKFRSQVLVTFEGQQVDGRSIVELLMLAARKGTQLTITVCGEDCDAALAALVDLVQRGFDEMEEKPGE